MQRALKVAAVSITSTASKDHNVEIALTQVRDAARRGAEWIQLPEMFPFHGPYDRVFDMAESEDGPLNRALASLAKELGIVLIAGTAGERPLPSDQVTQAQTRSRDGHRRVFNTCYVFGRSGERLAKYRKTHLFNLFNDDGTPKYCESDGYLEGDKAVVFSVDGYRVGLSICYDLRFSQFYDLLGRDGAPDVLAIPSAFTYATGKAHWELLLRARAVERQAFVYAANQTGTHGPGKESFGHSMIIDPWGVVLDATKEKPGTAFATIDPQVILDVRAKLPALKNRRPWA